MFEIRKMNIEYSADKNEKLKLERNISFEEVKLAIFNKNRGYIRDHHNQKKYPEQKIMYIEINNYFYVVPYVQKSDKQTLFLKTIYRSSRINKILQKRGAYEKKTR